MISIDESTRIGICTIATNDYVYFWQDMVRSAEIVFNNGEDLTFHVFTDQTALCEEFAKKINAFKIRIHGIPGLLWPAATLDRYRVFSEFKSELSEDVLFHLDADMIIQTNFLFELKRIKLINNITLVAHPGYWRPPTDYSYAGKVIRLLLDIKTKLKFGALGAWERRGDSAAYVPRKKRNHYLCGGVWFGKQRDFLNLCETLNESVMKDSQNGIMAKWHDESHLNMWASNNPYNILPPSFCYSKDYIYMNYFNAIIEAVTKNKSFEEIKNT